MTTVMIAYPATAMTTDTMDAADTEDTVDAKVCRPQENFNNNDYH
jgi:hypothetical protein